MSGSSERRVASYKDYKEDSVALNDRDDELVFSASRFKGNNEDSMRNSGPTTKALLRDQSA